MTDAATPVAELELPKLDYLDPTLRGERYHAVMRDLRERSWLAVSELGVFVLEREAAGFFLRTDKAAFPGVMLLELVGIADGPLYESLSRNIISLRGERHRVVGGVVGPVVGLVAPLVGLVGSVVGLVGLVGGVVGSVVGLVGRLVGLVGSVVGPVVGVVGLVGGVGGGLVGLVGAAAAAAAGGGGVAGGGVAGLVVGLLVFGGGRLGRLWGAFWLWRPRLFVAVLERPG